MTTVLQVLEEARVEALGAQTSDLNRLAGGISAGATSITLEFDSALGKGSVLAVEDEVFHVWSVTGKVATVTGAQAGTTAADHATGSIVEVNPIAPRSLLRARMIEEIRSWPESLFAVTSENVTVSRSNRTSQIQLTAPASEVRRVLEIREERDDEAFSTFESWPEVRHWDVVRGLTGADTLDIHITQMLRGDTVWVRYATEFVLDTFTDATDLETTVGVPAGWHDFLRMGTVMRVLPMREVLRARQDAQGAPRNAAEVVPQQNTQATLIYKTLRDQRIAEEAGRLRGRYPERGL